MKLPVKLHRGGLRRRAALAQVGVAVSVTAALGVSALHAAIPASADQVASARQQVAAAQAQAIAGARRVHELTLAYAQANLQASSLQELVASGQAEVALLQSEAEQASSHLRQEVIDSYMGEYRGVPSLAAVPAGSSLADPVVRAGYLSVASGDLRDSLDSYQATHRRLAAAQSSLVSRLRESASAASALQRSRDAAIAEATADQAALNALQVRLSGLEAAQAAAEAAAALSAGHPPAPPVVTAVAPAGPPVNGGLVAVVRSAVDQPPAAPVAAPPTTVAPATTTPSAPQPAPTPAPSTSSDGGAGGVWLQLRQCESGDDYQANTGNGFYGAYQFSQQTWTNLGFPSRPDLEPPTMQDQAAMKLQAESGWGQWPACSAALGLS